MKQAEDLLIYATDIFEGDAIGNHCLQMKKMMEFHDVNVTLAATNYMPGNNNVRDIHEALEAVPKTTSLLLHFSIFDGMLECLLKSGLRTAVYYHGITSPELLSAYAPEIAENCARGRGQLHTLNLADRLIATSSFTASDLAKAVGHHDIAVIPPCLPSELKSRGNLVELPDSSVGFSGLMSVGRIVPHKDIEKAFEVFKHLKEFHPNLVFSIFGSVASKDYFEFLINLARNEKILNDICFFGHVSNNELQKAYMQNELFISTSRHEGFNLPALEAMYAGNLSIIRRGTATDEFAKPWMYLDADLGNLYETGSLDRAKLKNIQLIGREKASEMLMRGGFSYWMDVLSTA